MDYEKKYNEALERVRRLHDRMQVLSSTDALVASSELEFIFPELAESEDERIRKELKEAFEAYDIESKWNGIPVRSIFAWLEKQKEPHYTKRNALFDKCVENCDPEVMKEVSDKVDEMLGKGQKPAEWSEEDEDNLHRVIRVLEDNDSDWKELSDWLKALRPDSYKNCNSRWKPSEEQMDALEAATVRYQSTGLESLFEDLKKL